VKVLLTGANGQLGQALQRYVPADVELRAVDRAQLDISHAAQVTKLVADVQPQLIINAAAYTAVDKAESDEVAAIRANIDGPAHLARALHDLTGARLIHVSTDFVFDGRSSTPYQPDDVTGPLGVYGRTKLSGEQAVLSALSQRALVVRTAWVYAAQGHNFLRTMLRLMNERGAVRVVADQVGTPTAAHSLAQVIWKFAVQPELSGAYHWTDAGVASWYDFAVAIAEEATAAGLLQRAVVIMPIATHEYPTPAKRPAYSVLDKAKTHAVLNLAPVHWRARLREVLREISSGR
jgi:dTDP-4-dehydrorhamnose reductase